jgi:hypothetical protein
MRYYADASVALEPGSVREDFCRRLQGSPCTAEQGARIVDALSRDALIYFGLLEQASADASLVSSAHAAALQSTLGQIAAATDTAAQILAGTIGGVAASAALLAALDRAEAIYRGRAVVCMLPEGYAFYGLFPELYIQLGVALAEQLRGMPVIVVGIRSIGTSLSAAVQAGLGRAGIYAQRFTVRPTGDPFARVTTLTADQAALCRAAHGRNAHFLIVDEGPGLSGSSIASAVWALEQLGVARPRMGIVCANRPEHLPMATAPTLSLWQSVRWWSARDLEQAFWHAGLPALLSGDLHTGVRLVRDLSWGAWSDGRTLSGMEAPLPHLERRKLLLEIDGREVMAKFVGFGEIGARKAKLYAMLSEDGFVPIYRGYGHGLLLADWVAGEGWLDANRPERPILLSTAASYYARIFRHARAPHAGLDLPDLTATTAAIAANWLGTSDLQALHQHAAMAGSAGVQALEGDQRPEPIEWLHANGRILKCDAADHFLDHTWARHLDICFDLAGFALEWSLSAGEMRHFLASYQEQSGDHLAQNRLPFFSALYAAHRLATFDLAYHAAQTADRRLIDDRRRAYGMALQQALATGAGNQCAL